MTLLGMAGASRALAARSSRRSRSRSRRRPLVSLAVALLGMGLVVVAVRWAVDNTLTRHAEVEPGSSLVVTIHGERQSSAEHDEAELVEAVVEGYRVRGRHGTKGGGARYKAVPRPRARCTAY